jgi:hypothetical protein
VSAKTYTCQNPKKLLLKQENILHENLISGEKKRHFFVGVMVGLKKI